MKNFTASPDFLKLAKSPTTESEELTPFAARLLTRSDKGKATVASTSTAAIKVRVKKKVGTRGKCRGCMRRDVLLEANTILRRQVVKKCDHMDELVAQVLECFVHMQEYVDIVSRLVHDIGKFAEQLSKEGSATPSPTEIVDLD